MKDNPKDKHALDVALDDDDDDVPVTLAIVNLDVLQGDVLSTSDFQGEVGEVFGEIGGELPAKFGRRFSSFFCWGNRQKHFPPKLHRKFHHQTSLRGSGLWRALNVQNVVWNDLFDQ